MGHSPSEANVYCQDISCLLWNPNVHYRVHMSMPNPMLSVTFRNDVFFLRWGVVGPSPNPKRRL